MGLFKGYKNIRYREVSGGEDNPSVRDCISSEPYEGKEAVLAYLINAGDCPLSGFRAFKDCFTGGLFQLGCDIHDDGEYVWSDAVAYYVERYNLQLDEAFVRKAIEAGLSGKTSSGYRVKG